MKTKDKISGFFTKAVQSIATLLKVAIMSRHPQKARPTDYAHSIVVLGNGPSLKETISQHSEFLKSQSLIAVNFAANTDVFTTMRPNHYILADPHFFKGIDTDPNVRKLWQNIGSANWEITLHIPYPLRRHESVKRLSVNRNIRVKTYNLTPAEGFSSLNRLLFRYGLAMPRPRNVLIPAIMTAIQEGFGTIYIAGADHTWTRTLSVNEQNQVVSIQPHFYADNDSEKARVSTEYSGIRLYQILESLYIAFRSYFDIADYARSRRTKILNVTPGSFIDAFERQTLPFDKES